MLKLLTIGTLGAVLVCGMAATVSAQTIPPPIPPNIRYFVPGAADSYSADRLREGRSARVARSQQGSGPCLLDGGVLAVHTTARQRVNRHSAPGAAGPPAAVAAAFAGPTNPAMIGVTQPALVELSYMERSLFKMACARKGRPV